MPPQGPPAQDAGPDASPQGQGQAAGGAISQMIQNLTMGIDHLNKVISQSKATSPEEKQMIGQVNQIFGELVESLGMSGGGDGGDESQAQGQTVPPEAAGNRGAMPSPM